MKNWSKVSLLLILSAFLGSCGESEVNTEFSVSQEPQFIIPAKAVSCYSTKTTGFGQTPTQDIDADYFKIPFFSFSRQNSDKDLIISLIKVTYTIPGASGSGAGATGTCQFDGDQLRALSSVWWAAAGSAEAVIPRAQGTPGDPFKTNCPAYCGGLPKGQTAYSTTATIEVFGLERDVNTQAETPVRLQGFVNLQSL